MTLRELTPFVLSLCLVGCGGDEPANTDNLQSASDLAGIDSGDETPETPNTETTDLESGGTPLIDDPSIPDVSEAPNTGETADPQPYGEQPFEAPDQGEGEQGSGEQESGEQESGEQGPGEEGESDEPTVVAGPGNNQPEATGDPTLDEIVAAIRAAEIDVESDAWRLQVPAPPEVEYDGETKYEWFLETNQGPLTIRLLPQVAPEHVTSTAYLSMLGFYDNLIFHRVIDGFMAQGGCPLGTGSAGPAYSYDPELLRGVNHSGRGALSMANAGVGTDGSQFFITFSPRPDLDRLQQHTVFGRVTSGWATLDKIEALADPKAPNGVPPLETIVIQSATVRVVPGE